MPNHVAGDAAGDHALEAARSRCRRNGPEGGRGEGRFHFHGCLPEGAKHRNVTGTREFSPFSTFATDRPGSIDGVGVSG